jgi:chromosome segregation ATPase
MNRSTSILPWLELLAGLLLAAALAPELTSASAWQAWRRTAQRQIPRPAEQPARSPPQPAQEIAELREIQDRIADASLKQFSDENELARLEDSRRQDLDRAAELRLQISRISQDLLAAREDRDSASREILGKQEREDAVEEAGRIRSQGLLATLQAELADKNLEHRVSVDRVRSLESQNFESDELVSARERSRVISAERDQLAARVDELRADLRISELAAGESRNWSLEQQKSDLFRQYESRVRELQSQSAALQEELDTIELRYDQSRGQVSEIEERLQLGQRQINELEQRRNEIMTRIASRAS